MPKLEFEPITGAQNTNQEYVQAHLAVASLTLAWHYILRVPKHEKAAERIEHALESAVRLRDAAKGR